MVFAERDERKPVLLRLSLAGNLVKPLLSLYGTEWRERGYGLRKITRFVTSNTFREILPNRARNKLPLHKRDSFHML